MKPLAPDHEDLRHGAVRILQAVKDAPIPAMDAMFYAHSVEGLTTLVEALLAEPGGPGGLR